MRSILILTGGHLCTNPRVIKEAAALQNAGYDVEVMGGWFDPSMKARDLELMASNDLKFRPLQDLTEHPKLRFWLRIRGRLANLLHARTGCESSGQLGYFVSSLTRAAYQRKPDLLIAHSEQALWAVAQVKKQKARIGVDMEDWFSEDLPAEIRKHRPVRLLRKLEQDILQCAAHVTCTSHAMSEALAKEYGCRPPAVIYNAFPWSDRQLLDGKRKDRQNCALPSVHWYSQNLGTDRGLGDLFAALPLMKREFEIHLRGNTVAGFENRLRTSVPKSWQQKIFIHPQVSNGELLSRIAEHDIGFAGEQQISRSRDVTVSNKILHYLLGGLAVLASDTTGQKEIAEKAKEAVWVYCSGNSVSLANKLNALLAVPELLRDSKASALASAKSVFCWERQIPCLLESLKCALAN